MKEKNVLVLCCDNNLDGYNAVIAKVNEDKFGSQELKDYLKTTLSYYGGEPPCVKDGEELDVLDKQILDDFNVAVENLSQMKDAEYLDCQFSYQRIDEI